MQEFNQERIIALDVRPQSLGFVVFEGQNRLLDWGVRSFPGGTGAVHVPPGPKVAALIALYLPEALVLKRPKDRRSEPMLDEIKQVAKVHEVALHLLSPKIVKRTFADHENKEQVAPAIAERFTDFLSILPPQRKIWRKEDCRMKIFDAAAVGIAYFADKAAQRVPSPPR
jgi:hypothetical protein